MATFGSILLRRAVGMMRLSRTILAIGILLGLAGAASAQSGCGGQFKGGTVCANPGTALGLPGPTTAPVLGIPGTSTGQQGYAGGTSGIAIIRAQPTAGSPILLWPTTSGTFPSTAVPPLVLDSVTGALSCPTCGGSITPTVVTVGMSPYTPLVTDQLLLVDTSGGAVTINLTASASRSGAALEIKDATGNADANNITVNRNGAETIDGLTSVPMDSKFIAIKFAPKTGGYAVV